MMNRRTFLETATPSPHATLLSVASAWAAADHKIDKLGVQLYSVRDQMKADFDATLAKVAAIGYKEVEFAGYFGRSPQAGSSRNREHGLFRPSTMFSRTCSTKNSRGISSRPKSSVGLHRMSLDP